MQNKTEVSYEQMLAQIDPQIEEQYVFASLPQLPNQAHLVPKAMIREPEGYTVALNLRQAKELSLPTNLTYTLITLRAPGSLDAVGLNSGIAQVLSTRSIPCNIFSGVHHTHIFVPSGLTNETKQLLDDISGQARAWLNQ